MTEKEKKRMLDKAAKMKPRPQLLPSGSWRCLIGYDGKKYSFTASTPEEAHAMAIAAKAESMKGRTARAEARNGNVTVREAVEQYIKTRERVLATTTIYGYNKILKHRFQHLMARKVRDVDDVVWQEEVNREAEVVSRKTIKNSVGLISSAIKWYTGFETPKIRLPRQKKKEHKFLDENGLVDFLDAIRGDEAEVPLLLAVWLGLRSSEILGLCWDCVDFEKKEILVARTFVKDKETGFILVDNTKTPESTRRVECPDYILAKLAGISPQNRTGRIFTMHPSTLFRHMQRICERNGIEFVGVHGLRHTNASLMLKLGIVDRVAQARGGWSTDATLKKIYQHIFASSQQEASDLINSFFGGVVEGKKEHEKEHEKIEPL